MVKNLEKQVRNLLRDEPKYRDNDQLLIARIWHDQLAHQIQGFSAIDLLKKLANGDLLSSEGISRCRRKLQEHNPDLRGSMWEKRHSKQMEIKQEFRNWWESDGEM